MTDLGDIKSVRKRNRQNLRSGTERKEMLKAVMGLKQGRELIADWLARCHVFASSFDNDALVMAFLEGERNIGQQILADVTSATPELYAQMLREQGERDEVRSVVDGAESAAGDASADGPGSPAYSGGPGPEPD